MGERERKPHCGHKTSRPRCCCVRCLCLSVCLCVCASVCGTSLCPFVGHFVVTLGHVAVVVVAGRMNMQYGIIYANFWHINRAGIFGAKLPGDVTDSPPLPLCSLPCCWRAKRRQITGQRSKRSAAQHAKSGRKVGTSQESKLPAFRPSPCCLPS